jgi:hypothetical protein
LEQKVRRAAAAGEAPLTLAEALRMGVHNYLEELLAKFENDAHDASGTGQSGS